MNKRKPPSPQPVSPATVLIIAGEAECDPRTVRRAIAGERVMPMTLERIRRAAEARGLGHLLP